MWGGSKMTEKRYNTVEVETTLNKYHNDYRATVGSLKKALENFDDNLHIGVLFDSEMAYTDIIELFEVDKKKNLVIINCE